MKIPPLRRSIVVAILALWAVGCTAPAGGASADPTEPAASAAPSAAPSASPASSGGGKYGDEYATPAP
ncbi:MAG: hypothetical protein ACSLFN_06340 [Candidatus Limnocylindrales bacterium]